MTPALGDFLTLARQHITAAAQHQAVPAAAHAEIITELDRLLAIMTRFARDGLRSPGAGAAPAVPTMPELGKAGTGLLLDRAAANLRQAAHALASIPARRKHPVAGHLRSAAGSLLAGRDLVCTHDNLTGPGHRGDPLWVPVMNSAPVTAALIRELAGYALNLAPLTARLAQPDQAEAVPPAARTALCAATGWLAFTGSSPAAEAGEPGNDAAQVLLYAIPANLPPGRQRPPAGQATTAELCAGTTAAAARLRHLALRPPGQRGWPDPSAAASWRHDALAAAIIGHTCDLTLNALTDRAASLRLTNSYRQNLGLAVQSSRAAWQSWRAVAHAWDPVTTGPSRHLSPLAAELDDLVLWTGRLARDSTWTPARRHPAPLRHPADLAPQPSDITAVLTAIAHATDATITAGSQDMADMQAAAAASAIYSPARLLPDSDDLTHPYRYRPASAQQITDLLTTYHQAITATEHTLTAIDNLLITPDTPSDAHPPARAIGHTTTRHHPGTPPPRPRPHSDASLPPGAGDIERLLHHLKVTDPGLVLRAAALDHATRALAAEAVTKALQLTHAHDEAQHCTICHSQPPRHSARLAAQDNGTRPDPTRTPSPRHPGTVPAAPPPAPGTARTPRA